VIATSFLVRPLFVAPDAPPLPSPAPLAEGTAEPADPQLGQLTDLGEGVLRSTAGLLYTPGSQEGHRLKHVLRHAADQPTRPGLHGVFDGDADDALAVIDQAYLLVKTRSPQVQSRQQGVRMVHEVDLRRKIGFVGGQEGRRRGNPPATHVRLVLEEDRRDHRLSVLRLPAPFLPKELDMHYVGSCPCCGQGLLGIRICCEQGMGLVVCEECEAIWVHPDLSRRAAFSAVTGRALPLLRTTSLVTPRPLGFARRDRPPGLARVRSG
jgi:hypothetical protein